MKPRTQTLYAQHCQRFTRWAFNTDHLPSDVGPEELDVLLGAYIETLWQEGEPKGWATFTLAGIQHFAPRFRRHLPGAWRLRSAWDRLELPQRAPPLTLDVVQALAGLACEIERPRVAAALMLGFHCLLRTGELLAAKAGDFEFSADNANGIINLHSTKGGVRRGQQEMVTIDDPILVRWLRRIVSNLLPGDLLLDCNQQQFRALFSDLCRTLTVARMAFRPYSLRRGGATYDYRFGGNLDRTVLRGRWTELRIGLFRSFWKCSRISGGVAGSPVTAASKNRSF